MLALNSDASVRAIKGPDRPIVPEAYRAQLLAALRCVDAVVLFEEPSPEALLVALKPSVYAKGGDYTANTLPEAPALQAVGAELAFLPVVEGYSTTTLIDTVCQRYGQNLKTCSQ